MEGLTASAFLDDYDRLFAKHLFFLTIFANAIFAAFMEGVPEAEGNSHPSLVRKADMAFCCWTTLLSAG